MPRGTEQHRQRLEIAMWRQPQAEAAMQRKADQLAMQRRLDEAASASRMKAAQQRRAEAARAQELQAEHEAALAMHERLVQRVHEAAAL